MSKKPVVLMILDGWGIGPKSKTNAAAVANTPNLDGYLAKYPHTVLKCSGEEVGLPAGQMGNSEVGHLNIGAGRIIYQELTRITKAIKDGDFYKNPVLIAACEKAKLNNGALHFMGLLSDGGVHSHIDHLEGLLKLAQQEKVEKVFVHAFLDGRDVPPKSALEYLKRLAMLLEKYGGKLATVSGRYYAMDRDNRWKRVQKAYEAMVSGNAPVFETGILGVEASYAEGVTDEFVVPFCVAGGESIKVSDSVIFFNFRPDRAREITRAINDQAFTHFERPTNARPNCFVCMCQYDETIEALVAFAPEKYQDTLGEVLAKHNLHQLRIAETEKYAHVTFFFNGGDEVPNKFEERILIPSPKVATYDLKPEMSAVEVKDALLEQLSQNKFDVVIINFANPDMVGHTGVLAAAIKAMETVDKCVGEIVSKVLELDGTICITADHGNVEQMQDEKTGTPYTAHTTNDVPFIMISNTQHELHAGMLADIAPTVLSLLKIEKPALMTGNSLLENKN